MISADRSTGDGVHGWRVVNRTAWLSAGLVALLFGSLDSVRPGEVLPMAGFAGVVAAAGAILFMRDGGHRIRPRPRRLTPLALLVAVLGGGGIGLGFALVVAAVLTFDLSTGIGLAAMCLVGGVGSEILVTALQGLHRQT